MLNDNGVAFTYREYTKDPLSEAELRDVFRKLGCTPHEVLRSRDAKKAGITNEVSSDALITAMVDNPKLLQRPIGVIGDRAVVGRPVDALLTIVSV